VRRAKEEAERANSAKSRFLANMSHEIRTPINTIMGMNEMAMREDASGVPQGYFMAMMNYAFDIRNASESLLRLIDDLLDISKVESGEMNLVEQEYNMQEMLRSVILLTRMKSEEKGLDFDVVIDEITILITTIKARRIATLPAAIRNMIELSTLTLLFLFIPRPPYNFAYQSLAIFLISCKNPSSSSSPLAKSQNAKAKPF
jgi:signal transduction histidine kinase